MSVNTSPTRGILATAALLGVIGATLFLIVRNDAASNGQEPSTRSEVWATGPAGQPGPITVTVPNYPTDPGEPVTKGPFRLLPFGYFDRADSTPTPLTPCARSALDPTDRSVVRSTDLYVTVGFVPDGFQRAEPNVSSACGSEVSELKWSLAGPKAAPLEILRGHSRVPFDVRVPPVDSWYVIEEGLVNGLLAIFLRNKPGVQSGQSIYFFQGDLLTIIDGPVPDFAVLLRIAESLR